MKRETVFSWLLLAGVLAASSGGLQAQTRTSNALNGSIAPGPFQANWESLTNYQCPEWFRDAKFGIWAHWGPQCQPGQGDWYARSMYLQGSKDYQYQLTHFGHPSKAGFKEVIHAWKAEKFDADKLLAFYQENGAKYFMALANHHDNFDNYNSKYQPWNSVKVGPHKDLIGEWASAARKHGLRFAVSVHAGRAWNWYEVAQRADTNGPLAGVPYDGKLTQPEGKGLWWEGLDPQELYAQNHPVGAHMTAAYCEKFFLRTKQLWDDYKPDMIYFDDGVMPVHQGGERYGLNLYAHFYNSSIQWHGRNEAVVNAKHLNEVQRKALVYDIERGKSPAILPEPWQTDTCIGQWHYNEEVLTRHQYKKPAEVIRMLVDIVSKNGNLMLSVPLRGDGTLDADEVATVSGIGAWLKVNGEAIYGTRPWGAYGEGPSTQAPQEANRFGGVKDVTSKPFTAQDFRFTRSKDGKSLYATLLAWPAEGRVTIKSVAENCRLWNGAVTKVSLLGSEAALKWTRDAEGLHVTLPQKKPCDIAYVLKIES